MKKVIYGIILIGLCYLGYLFYEYLQTVDFIATYEFWTTKENWKEIFKKINFLKSGYEELKILSKEAPLLAGALGVYGAGILTYFCRNLPNKIWENIKGQFQKQFTVYVTINNNDSSFRYFLSWFNKLEKEKTARTITVKTEYVLDKLKIVPTIGYGTHWIWYNWRPFLITRTEKQANNTTEIKESLTIKTWGRNTQTVLNLLDLAVPKPISGVNYTRIYEWANDNWDLNGSVEQKNLQGVILEKNIKSKLISHINTFKKDKNWYKKHHIPYRTGVILNGPPGTGKTSTILGLCGEFNYNLYILNINTMSDKQLEKAFFYLPNNALVLIEDIDGYGITKKRKNKSKIEQPNNENLNNLFSINTISGLLNAIDGVCSSENRLLIATTNHMEKLDEALIRPGRFDLKLKLDYLDEETVREMFNKFYKDFKLPEIIKIRPKISPAKFQAEVINNKNNPKQVLEWCQQQEVNEL